ncbi:hypothetical protein AVEN_31247-1 [Araneus ventricosus]|uniref:Uncharacterized protein n=1 Tax=Araneus ventricosus TaxID=182803 RepID=A0A4Y2A352_ARAVE|nr:hypothetical protein AVEN_31247-1 [Araneus ventricosus]
MKSVGVLTDLPTTVCLSHPFSLPRFYTIVYDQILYKDLEIMNKAKSKMEITGDQKFHIITEIMNKAMMEISGDQKFHIIITEIMNKAMMEITGDQKFHIIITEIMNKAMMEITGDQKFHIIITGLRDVPTQIIG